HTQGISMSPYPAERGTRCRVGAAAVLPPAHQHQQPPADGSRPTSLHAPSGRLLPVGSAVFALSVALMLFYSGVRNPIPTTVPFVLSTLLVAILWGRGPAITAAVAASATFNFFFVLPWDAAFSIPTVEEAVLLGGVLAVAVIVATMIARKTRVQTG